MLSLPLIYSNILLAPVRFRLVPSFGRETIRRFKNNVSDLKQLAARDYADILQVIAVYDNPRYTSTYFVL